MKSNNKSQKTSNKSSFTKSELKKEAETVVIQSVGYPFSFPLMDVHTLEISDKKLFEHYAKEQWLRLEVKKGDYLFDQKILPDYGFKILKASPNDSVIGENTSIELSIKENIANDIKSISTDLTLDDIIGQEKAKNKCKIIMKYLENPEKFGQWAPRNILFFGVPGTGKTMLAKSLTNELNVPLYLLKATTLIGDHVGDGARQIHDLFEVAQKTAPSVIFIDEIDAIALHRKFQSIRGDVSEIVNALLTEMDGIHENKGIVTIAATNNPEQLDYAIRSRFEDEFEFKIPSITERISMIEKFIDNMPFNVQVSSKKLAEMSKGMSGRDIKEKLLKSALHRTLYEDKEIIDLNHFEHALNTYKSSNEGSKNMFV
ncbi:Proteasome-activating nucleotidase [Candidatus Methanobinarius endosymbioticus]|uniref:Proteasome-activating nucleotidase n=1 Tax=Candidatus Methanobinarius endosymbioticus TaxID=2006182 RepID=A0A366MAR7_9EURY|nr:Proteasome-activating nucleotidase [Candidatus Methanobinarius endosymbioticus]